MWTLPSCPSSCGYLSCDKWWSPVPDPCRQWTLEQHSNKVWAIQFSIKSAWLRNIKFYYCSQKSTLLEPVLRQFHSVHILKQSISLKSILILYSHLQLILFLRFPLRNFVCISYFPHIRYRSHQPQIPWFITLIISHKIQSIKLICESLFLLLAIVYRLHTEYFLFWEEFLYLTL